MADEENNKIDDVILNKIKDGPPSALKIKMQKYLAIYSVGILVILTVLVILTYLHAPISILDLNDHTIQILIYTACAGGIGGAVYCMNTFTTNLKDIDIFFTWYLVNPVGAVFFGIFSYVLVAGGVLVLSGKQPSLEESISTTLFYCGLAFLAGFSTNQFMKKLRELADVVFSPDP